MKAVRVCFLLLLAVLLPVRGAVAATMLCAVGSAGAPSELRLGHHPVEHAAVNHEIAHDHSGSHDHAGVDHHGGGAHGQDAADKCTVCSACCSLTPLAATAPVLAEPIGLAAVKLSDHAAPPATFLSGGQERPPRTI